MQTNQFHIPTIGKITILLLFWILLFMFLEEFKGLLYPLVLSALFAYLLYPIANFLEQNKLPRILSIIVSIITAVVVLYGVFTFIYTNVALIVSDTNALSIQAKKNIAEILGYVETVVHVPIAEQKLFINNLVSGIGKAGSSYLNKVFKATSQTIFTIGIMPVYVFFMLFYRNKIYRFVLMLSGEDHDHISSKTINEINFVTKKYMQGIVTVVSILCVLNSLGLYLIGMKHFLLLGIIAAIMNFIPYFGTILGFAFPFLVALFLGETPVLALRVLGLFFIIQFTENNILTPNIVGGKLKINPLIIIISVLLGGRVWGLPGMFVVVPIIGMIKILCDNEPALRPYGYILGSEGVEKHAISFNLKKKKKEHS